MAEQKPKSLVAKQSPKQDQHAVRLMQSLRLSAGKLKRMQALLRSSWLSGLQAQLIGNEQAFQEGIARQLKSSQQQPIQVADLTCLSGMDRGTTIFFMDKCRRCRRFNHSIAISSGSQQAQSILTLDGYHVGSDWVIALHYDEDSQTAQGMLSHQVRLEEIQQQLAQKQPQLLDLENQFSNNSKTCNSNNKSCSNSKKSVKQKQKSCSNWMCKLPSYKVPHRLLPCNSSNLRPTETTGCAA